MTLWTPAPEQNVDSAARERTKSGHGRVGTARAFLSYSEGADMQIRELALVMMIAATAWRCGATTRNTPMSTAAPLNVSAASVTFMTSDDGKDEDSAIAVQLLDDESRLSGEATVVDVDFDDRTISAPLNLTLTRIIPVDDLDSTRVRLRLTTDGRDTWTFDMRMTLRLSNGTERQYFWSGLRLDDSAPERTLTLVSGRMP